MSIASAKKPQPHATGLHHAILKKLKENALGPAAFSHVDLTNMAIGPNEMEAVALNIQKNLHKALQKANPEISCPIASLNLSGNQICGVNSFGDGQYDYRGLQLFSSCLTRYAETKNFRIRRLVLSRNNLGGM